MFYIKYSILKDEIHIIITAFGNSESYGSRFWARCMVHNTYTGPRRFKIDHVDQTQLLVMKDDINFHYKKDSFNVIPQILSEKTINNLTIKSSCAPKIIDPTIFFKNHEGYCGPLCFCVKNVITFGKRKILNYTTHLM